MMPTPCYYSVHVKCMKTIHAHVGSYVAPTCTEDIMVLRANMVALSFTVDWLSKAPCVSSNKMATWKGSEKGEGRHKKQNSVKRIQSLAAAALGSLSVLN